MGKDTLVKGTIILAMAAFVARILGLVQRVPLLYLIHDSGMATFTIAFNIYTPLLTIATAGIPSALSKLISERTELGRHAEADRIFRAAVQFALIAGIVMTAILYVTAPSYARYVGDEDAILSIRALAPALLLFPLIAMMRGYFQGRQLMMPNGLSQVIEQVMRLVTAVGLAYVLLALGWGNVWAIAGSSFGGVMGSVGAIAVLIYYFVRLRRMDAKQGIIHSGTLASAGGEQGLQQIYMTIFKVSVPIVLFSMAVPLIYFIDSSTVIRLLQGEVGYGAAKELLGILGARAQSLAGIPIILAIALSQSIVPIISSAYARKDINDMKRQTSKALQLSVLTGLPIVLVIAIAARPINQFLFPATFQFLTNENGNGIIAFLTVTALFQIVMQTSGAILMGLGAMRPLVAHVGIGLVVKIVAGYLLAPWLGIYGVVAATALCFIVMMALNLRVLRQKISFEVLGSSRWLRLLVSTIVICMVGIGVERVGHQWITAFPDVINNFVNVVLIGAIVLVLYPLLLMKTRVITREDVTDFPAPIRKLIGRFSRLGKPKSNLVG